MSTSEQRHERLVKAAQELSEARKTAEDSFFVSDDVARAAEAERVKKQERYDRAFKQFTNPHGVWKYA